MIRIAGLLAMAALFATPVVADTAKDAVALARAKGLDLEAWQARSDDVSTLRWQTGEMVEYRAVANHAAQLRPRAEAGDVSAMLRLGYAYRYNRLREAPGSFDEAIKWYKMAADTGSADAMYRLGEAYFDYDGFATYPGADLGEGLAWLEKAATAGSAGAERILAKFYRQRLSEQSDPAEDEARSDALFLRAAQHGDLRAQVMMARMSNYGDRSDYAQALYWYRKAAAQGDDEALTAMDNTYAYGDEVHSYAEVVQRMKRDAEAGDSDAQWRYYGVDYEDLEAAGLQSEYGGLPWLIKSAAQHNSTAAIILAHLQDGMLPEEHIRQLAEAGNIRAKAEWATYELTEGGGEERDLAMTWLKQAAEANCHYAQDTLADQVEYGDVDPVEGLKWRILAVRPSLDTAGDVEDFAFTMSEGDRTEAMRRAAAWTAAHPDAKCRW